VFLPVAVCGNGVCETGEQCTDYECSAPGACRMDCPHFAIACPAPDNGTLCSGTGVCITASGQCECFGGYKGLKCDQCETGFARLMGSTGPCIRVPQPGCFDGASNGYEVQVVSCSVSLSLLQAEIIAVTFRLAIRTELTVADLAKLRAHCFGQKRPSFSLILPFPCQW
jgi:hypothetical protein